MYEDIESGLDFDVIPAKKDTGTIKSKTKSRSDARIGRKIGSILSSANICGVSAAWADARMNQQINAELKKMDEVQESIARRKDRIEILVRLFDAAIIGMKKDGLLYTVPPGLAQSGSSETPATIFGDDGADTALIIFISAENRDRKILIRGMAVATLRATEQDEKDKESLENAIEKSRTIFEKSQQGKLKPGWFYQGDGGEWRQVEAPEEDGKEKPVAKP